MRNFFLGKGVGYLSGTKLMEVMSAMANLIQLGGCFGTRLLMPCLKLRVPTGTTV